MVLMEVVVVGEMAGFCVQVAQWMESLTQHQILQPDFVRGVTGRVPALVLSPPGNYIAEYVVKLIMGTGQIILDYKS